MVRVLASHKHVPGDLEAVREFLTRTRWELRELRKVRVWADRFQVVDVNKDGFEVRGLGYADPDLVPLLRLVNAAFDPSKLAEPAALGYKEFDTGRRHPWAEDRVM